MTDDLLIEKDEQIKDLTTQNQEKFERISNLSKLNEDLTSMKNQVKSNDKDDRIFEMNMLLDDQGHLIVEYEKKIEKLENQLTTLKDSSISIEKLKSKEIEIDSLKKLNEKQKKDNSILKQDIEKLKEEKLNISNQLENEIQINEMKSENSLNEISDLKSKLETLQNNLNSVSIELDLVSETKTVLELDTSKMKQKIVFLEEKVKKFETLEERLKKITIQFTEVASLLEKEKNENKKLKKDLSNSGSDLSKSLSFESQNAQKLTTQLLELERMKENLEKSNEENLKAFGELEKIFDSVLNSLLHISNFVDDIEISKELERIQKERDYLKITSEILEKLTTQLSNQIFVRDGKW